MSDLFLRRCRKHRLNLDEAGELLVCPAGGHICDDFVVIDRKTGAVVNEVPADEQPAPEAPPGAREVLATLGRTPKEKNQMKRSSEEKATKLKRGELYPHGTYRRYTQEVRSGEGTCAACKKACSEYGRERRKQRLAESGKSPRTRRTPVERKAAVIARVARVRAVPEVVPAEQSRLMGLANEITECRARLARLVNDFESQVGALLQIWKLPAPGAEPVRVGGRRRG